MKRNLLCGLTLAAFALSAQAELIFDEPFDYSDGALTAVSSGVWANHSGSAVQMQVISGQAFVTEEQSEDVNRGFPGGPVGTNGYLYASLVLKFTKIPSGTGGYFAHFKDNTISGFKGRIFASTNGAAPGSLRVGVANGGSTGVYIPTDMSTGVTYTVVLRLNTTNASSTLWLNPTSEDSTANQVVASDSTSMVPIYSFALRQSTASGNGMGAELIDRLMVGTSFSDVYTPGDSATNPPVISSISDQSIPRNSATPAIPFTVIDNESLASSLTVTASSGNTLLVPNANVVLGGTDPTNRTITVTPAAGQQGIARITIMAQDPDNNISTRSFSVRVGSPTISVVGSQITPTSTPTAVILFTVGDAEEAAGSLTMSGYSSVPGFVSGFAFGGSGSSRTVVIAPAAGASGMAVINLAVSDGFSSTSNQFILTVAPVLALDIDEPFNYADGLLPDLSAGNVTPPSVPWVVYSPQPATNDCSVVSQQLKLASTNSDDVAAFIGFGATQGYYDTTSGYVVYYSLKVRLATLPDAGGTYFAFVKDTGTSNFRARVFAVTNGAAPGYYRLGIAAGFASPTATVATDLTPGSTYTATVRYNVGTGDSTLWLNAANETSASVNATDATPLVNISMFALRQNTNEGVLFLDNVKVGTGFASVYQAPNWPPTISGIPDTTTAYQTASPAIPFTVGDVETPAGSLTLSVASSDPTLAPTNNIAFGGSGANRTVTVTPAAGQSGTSTITVTVTDTGGNFATTSFVLTVRALNNPPFISAIPNMTTNLMATSVRAPFTVYDLESPATSLHVRGVSSNPALAADDAISFGSDGSGSNRTVTVNLTAGVTGTSTITVYVDDGVNTNSTTFTVTVNLAILFADTFSYADGSITTNSSFRWVAHSGATGQTQVINGQLRMMGAQSEDISAWLTNAPFPASGGAVLYAGFTVNFSALPGSDYFAHFRDTGTQFRAKVFGTLSNAAPGSFRLGIANAASTLGATNPPYPMNLSLGTDYRVVVRYYVGTGVSTLWINPAAESDPSLTPTDTPSTITVTNYSFRQSSGIGTLTVDELKVGTSFDAVLGSPPAPKLSIVLTSPSSVQISWPLAASDSGYVLQSKAAIGDSWATHPDQGTTQGSRKVVTINTPSGSQFFQLVK